MVEIPVIVTAPDCHPLADKEDDEEIADKTPGESEPDVSPVAHEVKPTMTSTATTAATITALVSEGTQTETEPASGKETETTSPRIHSPFCPLSPARSHTNSPGPKSHFPPFPPWRELRHRLYGPHATRPGPAANEAKVEGYLSPPETEPPQCPMTPQADLYHGQSPSTFGMQFERPAKTYWRRYTKPATCAQNYEDHKHRMLMEWLERRNSV
ncbi:uncharacterized protein A1O5_08759 [Cladophialophora psammophila CBS 110553]|uniref:Uncharacterized protein n=1 Tax=Cladophialophora psammophila CBS 110553 TaxID=1182543 RepID=W9XCH8_9EURO|nr:uncharacterized protein A1O5_08759 [Cladophialophora psammophila CBS 110553]EXJ68144.1 hypothetical protein A1O5_08759 [Cladophialophora psammophila CBS 110553]